MVDFKDGRWINSDDRVKDINLTIKNYIVFTNNQNWIKIIDKDGKIIVDFAEKNVSYEIVENKILTLDSEHKFKFRNSDGLVITEIENVEHFLLKNNFVVLRRKTAEKTIFAILNLDGEIEASFDDDITFFDSNSKGTIALQMHNQSICLIDGCDSKIIDTGFDEIQLVSFGPNDEMIISGIIHNVIITTLFIKDEKMLDTLYPISFKYGNYGEVLAKVSGKFYDTYLLFSKRGTLLHKGKLGEEIAIIPEGAVISNLSNHKKVIYHGEKVLFDFKEKAIDYSIIDDNLYTYKQKTNWFRERITCDKKNLGNNIVDKNNVIPQRLKENIYIIRMEKGFICIYRLWEENFKESEQLEYLYFKSLTVLNSDGEVVANELENFNAITGISDLYAIPQSNQQVKIHTEYSTYCVDQNGKIYDDNIILGTNGEIYKNENGVIVTVSIPKIKILNLKKN